MKITYDKIADAMYIKFSDLKVAETKEDVSGNLIIDYAIDNSVIGIEVLNALVKINQPDVAELQML